MEAKASLIYNHASVTLLVLGTLCDHAYLEQIYIFLGETNLFQYFWYGYRRSNAHDTRSQPCSSTRLNQPPYNDINTHLRRLC